MNRRIHYQTRTAYEIEKIVTLLRLHFYNRGQRCGAAAIQHHMKELQVKPLPSVTTIGRILTRCGLTHGRTGLYEEDVIQRNTEPHSEPQGNNQFEYQKKRLDIHQNKE